MIATNIIFAYNIQCKHIFTFEKNITKSFADTHLHFYHFLKYSISINAVWISLNFL